MDTKVIGFWILLFVAIFGSVFFLAKNEKSQKEVKQAEMATDLLAVRDTDHVKGDAATADVVIVEYSDFQCPACERVHEVFADVDTAFDGKVAFVYRHFPLNRIHPHAADAAWAAEAAGQQGKFWEMHDKLFETQADWTGLNPTEVKDVFAGYAVELELDAEAFAAAYESDAVRDHVRASEDEAMKLRLRGTPTVFVNGEPSMTPTTKTELGTLVRIAEGKKNGTIESASAEMEL